MSVKGVPWLSIPVTELHDYDHVMCCVCGHFLDQAEIDRVRQTDTHTACDQCIATHQGLELDTHLGVRIWFPGYGHCWLDNSEHWHVELQRVCSKN